MGCDGGSRYIPGPCPNCTPLGRNRAAIMGTSNLRYGIFVCSSQCGIRLESRIKNGMIANPEPSNLWGASGSESKEKRLRMRIKLLESRCKSLSK